MEPRVNRKQRRAPEASELGPRKKRDTALPPSRETEAPSAVIPGKAAVQTEPELEPPKLTYDVQDNLPQLELPFEDLALDSAGTKLDPAIVKALNDMGLAQTFAIQGFAIPKILAESHRDICIRAPTGSGKTLCYLIPIIQELIGRVLVRLRALIILPTRDLAMQVKTVFDTLAKYTDLKSEVVIGTSPFHIEQQKLLHKIDNEWCSKVDVLITTTGRITDHVTKSPGFTLSNLRFFVIDEADEVTKFGLDTWFPPVHKSFTKPPTTTKIIPSSQFVTWEHSVTELRPTLFQKLLFSATLLKNVQRDSVLDLRSPLILDFGNQARKASRQFALPEKLKEEILWCEPGEKPLVLIQLLNKHPDSQILCFTSSVESTHRLYRLLESFGGFDLAEFSASIPQESRNRVVTSFRKSQLKIIISSDLMARGMDFEGTDIVVNYDVPIAARLYVHRAGRTARAGRHGICYTIAKRGEQQLIKNITSQTSFRRILETKVSMDSLNQYVEQYQKCLVQLKAVVQAESMGILSQNTRLKPSEYESLSTRIQRMLAAPTTMSLAHTSLKQEPEPDQQAALQALRSQLIQNMLK